MLSKLALIGAVAYQTHATQLFSSIEEQEVNDMVNLFNDVQMEQADLQSLLKISLNKENFEEKQGYVEDIKEAAKKYEVSKKIQYKAKYYAKELLQTKEAQDLREFIETNMPAKEVTVDGEEYLDWHPDFKPLVDQRMKVKKAAETMKMHAKKSEFDTKHADDVQAQVEVRNEDWEIFDKEVGKLVIARKNFINSKWGRTCIKKIDALRETDEYEKLEDVWTQQTETDVHKDIVEKVDDFLIAIPKLVKIDDDPESFLEGNFMKEFKNFIDMMMHAANGDTGDIFDWIHIQQEMEEEE